MSTVTPFPGSDLDPIGPLLRDLDNSLTELQAVDARRLVGDRITIDGALLALTIIRERINKAAPRVMDAAE